MNKPQATEKDVNRVNKNYIIGIGASAGGLEALQKLLSSLPPNTGCPYIIVQHLSPDYKSLLTEILGKYTSMPVIQVEDGMEIKPDCVYVIHPGKIMRLVNGKLRLTPLKEHELNLPIDMFFRSLAEEAKASSIAIILSGTGSDGTNGIKSIKENEGFIIVQSPESAKFDGMPRSALRSGLVDAQLTPEEIAIEIQHITSSTLKDIRSQQTEEPIDDDLMKRIYFILKKICNVNFTHYKQTTILRRIERRIMLTHKESLEEYVAYLYESPEEVKTLSKEVLIGVTSFFRDSDFFQSLKDKVVQSIVLHSAADEAIRVWVAGCSTGEEAYSIAILFCEVMETLKIKRSVKIFATDLDVAAVTQAGKGVYSENIIDSVSAARLSRYFTRQNNTFTINRDIRKMVIFSPHNVFQDPPFGKLDLISCRNMLIYFQTVLQNDLFAIFHAALKDGGYLFLGKSEAIGLYTEAYPVVDAAAKIFAHRSNVKIEGAKTVPYLQTSLLDDELVSDDDSFYNRRSNDGEGSESNQHMAIDIDLLERFMPACLVINGKNELIHTYGENSNYIHFSIGKVSIGLYDVLTEALKIPVSALLREARAQKQAIQYRDVQITGEREKAIINITVLPLSKKVTDRDDMYAVVFTEAKQRGEIADAIPYEINRAASQRISNLEQELSDAQEKLKKSVAEQDCANEELQAANEELLTSNEELQSSNEELQSVNEELYTVNSEYQQKMSELADLNDDIANFLSSTLIGIIFVDNKLNIRRFTDYVASEFNVLSHDIGRPLNFISYYFPNLDIGSICNSVLKTLTPDEREISTVRNKAFLMRVAPYRTTENKILGCVITLIDISTQKQGQAMLESTEQQLSIAQQASEAKSDFLSRVSHEIRTPMNTLVGLAELAKSQIDNKITVKKYLNQITDTVKYMTSIISDILEISKIEHNEMQLISMPFSLNDALDKVLLMTQPKAAQAGLTLKTTMPENFPTDFVGDQTRLQQILINFLTNAVKYTPKGGTISFEVRENTEDDKRSTLCFTVSDTGIGISKEFMAQMFKPFSRENKYDPSSPSNMGLGLSIAYSLVRLMNGSVNVESEPGRGTTFNINIPFVTQEKSKSREMEDAARSNAPVDYGLSGYHVLIAEDHDMNREIMASLLKQQGMTCAEVQDGEEAVKAFVNAPAHTYDCILMDIYMPKFDGIQATKMIRESNKEDAKSIPILGVSANGFPDEIKKAYIAGIDNYTTKPIDKNKLFHTMSGLIKHKDS